MDKAATIEKITETLSELLSQLDDSQQHVAAVKVAEAITALSETGFENGSGQDI